MIFAWWKNYSHLSKSLSNETPGNLIDLFFHPVDSDIDAIQSRFLKIAAGFLFINAIGLSISPAVSAQSWQVDFLWTHWVGFVVWWLGFNLIDAFSRKYLTDRDPFLIPIIGLLSGWGLLMIYRLYPEFGLRQSAWLIVSVGIFIGGLYLKPVLSTIRRYKYLWLTASLLLTAATLIWGTNPQGSGPEMWLGCCGIYFQPSEPLKLMLIAYLAAYLADQQPFLLLSNISPKPTTDAIKFSNGARLNSFRGGLFPLLVPTFIMTGLALVLLIIQQDLGTAIIFLILYAIIIYVASGQKRIILFAGISLLLALVIGYQWFDVIQIRIEAWLNPFLDPTGGSYQIVQSLIAIANGENIGRGIGIGYPHLVPVAHSDLIFTSIVEEYGLIGAIALIACLSILFYRGVRIALNASDAYQRYLGIGLIVFLVGQSLLIIGGGLRLLPLTGVTLPFVSYGGSSLLVSFISLLFLLKISHYPDELPAPVFSPQVYGNVATVFLGFLALISLSTGWWALIRSPSLLSRTDNIRRSISDLHVRRGSILDRRNFPISESVGQSGNFVRRINHIDLSNVFGYTDPTYGQSGLEASMDDVLRGMQGNSPIRIWWNRLLSGFPPEGRDIRTSIDLQLQTEMDISLRGQKGAGILMNAKTGEILSMSSQPSFDGNHLDDNWNDLVNNQDAPLLNRAIQGRYPIASSSNSLFDLMIKDKGVLENPQIHLPVGEGFILRSEQFAASPLQVVLMSAAISNMGIQPAAWLVTAVDTDAEGWTILPPLDKPAQLITEIQAQNIAEKLEIPGLNLWQDCFLSDKLGGGKVTWYVGGISRKWEGTPLAIVVLLETADQEGAIVIGQSLLLKAMQP